MATTKNYCSAFHNGYAVLKLNGKANFISKEGEFLSLQEWFEDAKDFVDGLARVKRYGKWNFITLQGTFFLPTWYDYLEDFREGFAVVGVNNQDFPFKSTVECRYNYIDKQRNYISEDWYDKCYMFLDGRGMVQKKIDGVNKYNFINKQGKIISYIWSDRIINRWCKDYFVVEVRKTKSSRKYLCGLVDSNGHVVGDKLWEWCDCAFWDGFTRVFEKGKWNFIDKDGTIQSSIWFDGLGIFGDDGYSFVEIGDEYYWIDKDFHTNPRLFSRDRSTIITLTEIYKKLGQVV